MILIITTSRDLSADLVIRHLVANKDVFIRLDTDKLGTPHCFFGFRSSEPELRINGRVVRPPDVTAVWARRFAWPLSLRQIDAAHVDFVRRELAVVMDAFLESVHPACYMNSPDVDRQAGNRLLQATRAHKVGFSIPASLVTQDPVAVDDFLSAFAPCVTKAMSFGRITAEPNNTLVAYASVVDNPVDLSGLAACPSLFQEMVPKGFDWRVTTVGEKIFSARRAHDSEKSPLDWRQADNASWGFGRAELTPDIADCLLRLTRGSGAVFGAHDLVETPEGEFFFLETNPAGQWGWLELSLGLPIGQAISSELALRK